MPSRSSPTRIARHAGHREHEDERLGGRVHDHPPERLALRCLERVCAARAGPASCLFGRQAERRIDVQRGGDRGRRVGVVLDRHGSAASMAASAVSSAGGVMNPRRVRGVRSIHGTGRAVVAKHLDRVLRRTSAASAVRTGPVEGIGQCTTRLTSFPPPATTIRSGVRPARIVDDPLACQDGRLDLGGRGVRCDRDLVAKLAVDLDRDLARGLARRPTRPPRARARVWIDDHALRRPRRGGGSTAPR